MAEGLRRWLSKDPRDHDFISLLPVHTGNHQGVLLIIGAGNLEPTHVILETEKEVDSIIKMLEASKKWCKDP